MVQTCLNATTVESHKTKVKGSTGLILPECEREELTAGLREIHSKRCKPSSNRTSRDVEAKTQSLSWIDIARRSIEAVAVSARVNPGRASSE